MIDLHAHILPNIDDGAESMDESVEMAMLASATGVKAIAVTPHSYALGEEDFYTYDSKFDEFKKTIFKENIDIEIYPSMEVFACNKMIRLLEEKKFKTINQTKYVLVEFAFGEDVWMMKRYIEELKEAGYIPVIAHPERYRALQESIESVYEFVKEGSIIQINKGSVLGRFGRKSYRLALEMLENNFVHVVASDAHGSMERTTGMLEIYNTISRKFSTAIADLLLKSNPEKILKGESV